MKKFSAIFAMLCIAAFTFAQEQGNYFAPINWGASPSDVSWADAAPVEKTTVTIPMAPESLDGNIDIGDMTAEDVLNIWPRIGDVNLVPNQAGGDAEDLADPFDLDESGEGTFGACWKAFYDSEALYVIIKYVDTDEQSTARWFELPIQTKEYDRYNHGWTYANDNDLGNEILNDQYGRYVELGGMKLRTSGTDGTTQPVFDENVSNTGQDGGWSDGIGGTNVGDVASILAGDNTLWFIVELEFGDLKYMMDEWGDANEAANHQAMDPTVETMISFDVSARATFPASPEDLTYSSWWNSEVNNGYKYVVHSGILEFGTDVFFPVGLETNTAANDKLAYIYNDMLRLKGYDNPVDLDVYSIIGQRVLSAQDVSSELNVSELNSGVYIVKVRGTQESYKVLK